METPVKQRLESHELVKYMSKLPVFLERAETTPQEKLLSVGVLDWGRLEKWQHSHNRVSMKSRFPMVSQADALLAPPPRGESSSAGPSKVQNRSSDRRLKHRSSRQSSVMPNSVVKECEEIKCTRRKKHKDRRCFSVPEEQFGPSTNAQGLDVCEEKDLKGKICSKNGTLSHGLNPEAGLNMEVKSKADVSRHRKSEKNLHERNRNEHDGELGRKQHGEAKTCKRSSNRKVRVVHGVEGDYCTQHSCPLPCNADGCLAESKLGSTDADQKKVSVELSQCVSLLTKARNKSSKGKISEDRASSLLSVKHCMYEPCQRQDSKTHKVTSEKGRSISPFQRLSFNMGKASKTNSEGGTVPTTQLDSMTNSTKIDSQNVALLSDVDGSNCNKPSKKDTTTTSHLRRLLEPLLKPRAANSGNSVEGPKGQGLQRLKLGITGCKSVNVNDSAHGKKLGSSMVRAVLRVTVKNNQPLFTFAVNKETDIIAATQKKMGSSEEGECTSVYTFFSIKDHKRNSGWLNQRGSGQTHGLISNVVAQMRVSSSLPSGSIREFVLFSVELDRESTEKSDLQLKNELAAIIVKMPRLFHRRAPLNTVQDHNATSGELEDHIKDKFFDQDISATVILQSGVHSMPQKGGPSSLIQRWRTGGSCDCGGWDMGCNLRILTNQHNLSYKKSATSNSPPSSNRFELFFLGEQAEEHPFLSFKPIKEGIYSVAYNSSLSQLQAFSICMALAESRKMSENILEQKSSCDEHKVRGKTVLLPDQDSNPNGNTVGYQPPFSPVGRV
ncbi:unnamed protein product [Arabidopsis thaliana]|uniref:Uncharacterized protein n=1 Tax=Arabidopsis thaliana TaxID=3702 RepID=A0A5S9YFD0_ARATH|nr:unnamed protein product [Arabidopsis thaliana]VYS70822.1 unnamed protein product [Arabidopsis thaliana]